MAHIDQHRHEKSNVVEMAEELKKGELPSNNQITKEMDKAKEFFDDGIRDAKRPDEARVMKDMKDLVDAAERTLEDKNRDDLIQKFMDHATSALERTKSVNSEETLLVQATKTLTAIRAMMMPLVKSQSFRQSLVDLFEVLKDMLTAVPDAVNTEQLKKDFVEGKDASEAIKQDVVEPMKDEANSAQLEQKKKETRKTLRNVAQEISKHPESNEAYRALLNLWGLLTEEFYAQIDRAKVDADIAKCQDEALAIAENIFGGHKLDEFLRQLRIAVAVIKNDQELSNYLKECQAYLQKVVDHPEVIDNKEYFDEGSNLIEKGRKFADKYRNNVEVTAVFDEAAKLAITIKNDEQIKELKRKAAKLTSDLTTVDSHGNRSLNARLINLLRAKLIPFMTDRIKEIPIPGFEVINPEFEYLIVDDLFLTIDDILPDTIKIHTENDTKIVIESTKAPVQSYTWIHFKIDGIRPKVKDFYFRYKRRDAIIAKQDEGRASMRITGDGLNAEIKYELDINDNQQIYMRNAQIKLDVDAVSVDVLEAKNSPILLNMATTFFKGRIQKEVEKAIKWKLEEYGGDLAKLMNEQIFEKLSVPNLRETLLEKLE